MIYYFAYGSNLHPMRLLERVSSAELIGTTEIKKYCLTFHKKSTDGSSKCNLFETGESTDYVYGAIYKIDSKQKEILDGFEGLGQGYIVNQLKLQYQEREYLCFTYLAEQSHIVDNMRPYNWYKEMVVLGARHLKFPKSYIEFIDSVDSNEDPKINRRNEKETLLKKMRAYL